MDIKYYKYEYAIQIIEAFQAFLCKNHKAMLKIERTRDGPASPGCASGQGERLA